MQRETRISPLIVTCPCGPDPHFLSFPLVFFISLFLSSSSFLTCHFHPHFALGVSNCRVLPSLSSFFSPCFISLLLEKMASVAQVHYPSPVSNFPDRKAPCKSSVNSMFSSPRAKPHSLDELRPLLCGGGGGGSGGSGVGHGSGGGGGNGNGNGNGSDGGSGHSDSLGPIGFIMSGWRSRVAADPQFPFKVLMEEVVGVSSAVVGDMASRPNFGLNELDFVFSTVVVGFIVNFAVMYLLAPTMASTSGAGLPWIFANCPAAHMFEPGSYSLVNRMGTFVYKGTLFAAVGLAAGFVGTALSNGLIKMRKKMDPNFEPPNKPPPTLLNAITWAIHMGVGCNLRYQALNGIEFFLAKCMTPALFKSSVIGLRMTNNVIGGVTFVMLARMTGSQSSGPEKKTIKEDSLLHEQDEDRSA